MTSIPKSSRYRLGFTLIELLVVVGIVGILAGLLLTAISHGRFKSKVTTCTNNYRQWGIAVSLYASEDGKGRLPSFELPVSNMTGYRQLEPYFVPYGMVTNMVPHGVTVPMWFCPIQPKAYENRRLNFRYFRGRELSTVADLVDESENFQKAAIFATSLMWWVPRRLEGSTLEFPNPDLMETRVRDAWPRRMEDPTISTMPIISDWLVSEFEETTGVLLLQGNAGGHAWAGDLKNCNSGFADGHVETRPKARIQWQAKGPGHHVYAY